MSIGPAEFNTSAKLSPSDLSQNTLSIRDELTALFTEAIYRAFPAAKLINFGEAAVTINEENKFEHQYQCNSAFAVYNRLKTAAGGGKEEKKKKDKKKGGYPGAELARRRCEVYEGELVRNTRELLRTVFAPRSGLPLEPKREKLPRRAKRVIPVYSREARESSLRRTEPARREILRLRMKSENSSHSP